MEQSCPNSQFHLKIMAQCMSKMAKFFNDMTEECLLHISDSSEAKKRQQAGIVRQWQRSQENRRLLSRFQEAPALAPAPVVEEKPSQPKIVTRDIRKFKPKHPMSSFFYFFQDVGPEVARTHGMKKGSKIAKIVGEMWKNLPKEEREPYLIKSKQNRQKYEKDMLQFRTNYAEEIKDFKKLKKQIKTKKKPKTVKDKKTEEACSPQPNIEKDEDTPIKKENVINESQNSKKFDESEQLSLSSEVLPQNLHQQMEEDANEQMQPQVEEQSSDQSSSQESQSASNQQPESISKTILKQKVAIDEFPVPKHDLPQLSQGRIEVIKSSQSDSEDLINDSDLNSLADKDSTIQGKTQKTSDKEPKIEEEEEEMSESELSKEPVPEGLKRPKGPTSSFFIFYRVNCQQLSKKFGIPPGPKLIKQSSEVWHGLSAQDKVEYDMRSKLTRDRYHRQVKEMKERYGEDVFNRTKNNEKLPLSKKKKVPKK